MITLGVEPILIILLQWFVGMITLGVGPILIMEKITSLLRSFIWIGSDLFYGNAKVAWDTICLPKKILKYGTGQQW